MFQFEKPEYFLALLIIPLLWLLKNWFIKRDQKQWLTIGNIITLRRSIRHTNKFEEAHFILFLIALFFICVALANPQFGKKSQKIKTSNTEIFIALDLSQSMNVQDVLPSRLVRAQLWIKQFTEQFRSEKIGLISFAGSAYLQSPLTTDMATIQHISGSLEPGTVTDQGTSLASAIELALSSFLKKNDSHKVLILLTDGEDHEGEAIEMANKAADQNIHLICVPIGTEQGGQIPVFSPQGTNYKRDEKGNPIISKPNRELLKQIGSLSNGQLIEISSGESVFEDLKKEFSKISKQEVAETSFEEFQSYYQYFLFIGLVCIIFILWKGRKK